jgi:hypothetical protein
MNDNHPDFKYMYEYDRRINRPARLRLDTWYIDYLNRVLFIVMLALTGVTIWLFEGLTYD